MDSERLKTESLNSIPIHQLAQLSLGQHLTIWRRQADLWNTTRKQALLRGFLIEWIPEDLHRIGKCGFYNQWYEGALELSERAPSAIHLRI